MTLSRLVLFDIDGTLLWPDGAGRAALRVALEHVYGTAGPIDSYQFGGCTDRQIVSDLMGAAGIAQEVIWRHFEELGEVMAHELRRRVEQQLHNIRPCPGGPELVAALAGRPDALVGLLTGNLPLSAHIKLEAAGYAPSLFRVAAYGSESVRRADLPPLAVARAAILTGVEFRGQQVVIIGDTPADVACGRSIGARTIVVLTGWCPRAELEAASPDSVFDDLTDSAAVLAAIFAPEGKGHFV